MSTTPAPSPTRLRQIALIAQDIERAKYLLTTILGTEVVYIDPQVAQWGIKNFLVAIGGDIIEVCSPLQPGTDTTVGRLLEKRGDGGYMIIMQTLDAGARRTHIESKGLAKVIFSHSHDDVQCIQYHPKGIAGGMMPELDSHTPSPSNPTPLASPHSPWHACGPDYASYSSAMKRCSHLRLLSATCRLAPGQTDQSDTEAAAQQWEEYFGITRQNSDLVFTNARLKFVPGVPGGQSQSEGLESITIQVTGKDRFAKMLDMVSKEGLCGDGWTNMLGIKWYFVLSEEEDVAQRGSMSSKL
ncbi:hypothetical protein LTR96_009893 [Exophiala xenobiotica]|uniref:Glyoxalase-like domain-containing protein n=1 Tax=Vermiconidia calcicola TaxID=1690605 RepID=A0AAV9PXJ3_9PEZI|nr:hypothetical protein LTR92_008559 [Exophiala xenobiotica]KAK5531479.1 hypothetical protein LTR25_008588 [Vermiconidia calcicola]KAK5207071.1 hypothetical protein LTR41_007138 [Exophiala xenobiotica]KAK5227487.1 hypothetical protein LTR47_008765 [Exophiala xenobiotica]KAK5260604.1 hypothetical protein LTR40_003847 [Exophiala xenobiotica]